jgi:MFS transporter, OFA family, oxalate/formate antiporter
VRVEKSVVIVAVFVGLMAGFPSSYLATATTFILPLTQEFGWGRIVPSTMYLCSMAGIALASIWLGRVIERFGAARVALASGACLAGAQFSLGLQTGSPMLAFAICFLAGALGAGTSVGLYLTALPRWFDHDLGKALGISIVGMSVGVTVMPALAASVSITHGWRGAYFILATVQLALTLFASLLLVWLGHRKRSAATTQSLSERPGLALRDAVRTRSFWLLAAMVFFATLGVFGPSFQLLPLYSDLGVASAMLPIIAVMLGLGTLLGRLCSGFLLDHMDARIIAAVTFAIGGAGILWLALIDQMQPVAILCIPPLLLGAALGAESDIIAYMARRFFGLRHHAAIYNRILIVYYLGAVTGPLALGWAFDRFSESTVALTVIAMCCLGASAIATLLPASSAAEPTDRQTRDVVKRSYPTAGA